MGKRIIQQRRGRGTLTYRVKKNAFKHKLGYPLEKGKAKILKLFHSAGHNAPLIKAEINKKIFCIPAFVNSFEGQEFEIGGDNIVTGNVIALKYIPFGTEVYSIENAPGDGGKMIRSSGTSATVSKEVKDKIAVLFPSKKEKIFNGDCRAIIGVVAGHGKLEKPIMKAGKQYYIKKAKSKLWPRTSAVAMNVIDHPMGSGRGKNVSHGMKGKIPRRNAPPGAKVGSLRPRRTGRKKK